MKLQHIIFVFLLVIYSTSCKKYLDVKPDKKLVVPTTIKDFQALLDNGNVMNERTPSWDEASADDYYFDQSQYQARAEFERQAYVWDNRDYNRYPNDWSFIYDVVYHTNIALEGIEKIDKNEQNESDWNNVKGSALFFRAYSFFRALILFSKAYDEATATQDYGVVLRSTADFNAPSVRSNVKDSYGKVIQDLKEASSLLPVNASHLMRPSKLAAYAILARTYLSMRSYDSCFKYADLCLQLNNRLLDYTNPSEVDVYGFFPFQQFNPEVLFHTITLAYTFINAYPFSFTVDSTLYTSYSNNDLRKDAYFIDFGSGPFFKGTYDGSFSNLFNGIAIDEIYLMRAECHARKGNITNAMSDLNALLIKRWKANTFNPFSATTAQDAVNLILSERRKELCFRNLRWMDIKRLNKEGLNIIPKRLINGQSYQLSPNDNKYALPLPSDIINSNSLPQNPK